MTYVWHASYGRQIPVDQMTHEHLINALNWIEKAEEFRPLSSQSEDGYVHLKLEAMRRGIRWRYFRGRTLQDGQLTLADIDRARRMYNATQSADVGDKPHLRANHHVSLYALEPGRQFFYNGMRFITCRPYGVIDRGLQEMRHRSTTGSYVYQGIVRYVVTNLQSGATFMMPGYTQVQPII